MSGNIKNNNHQYCWKSGFYSQLPVNLHPNVIIITGFDPPLESIGNIGDIYIDLSTGQIYEKFTYPAPSPPNIRPLPTPSQETIKVSAPVSINDNGSIPIQSAINSVTSTKNDIILGEGTFNLQTVLSIPSSLSTSLTIEGQGIGNTLLTTSTLTDMFNITNGNVTIKNMTLLHNFNKYNSDNDESAVLINNNTAMGIYIDSCEFAISEFAINSNAAQIQVTNCTFKSNTDPNLFSNRYGCVYMTNSTGNTIISNNTIITTLRTYTSNTGACSLVRITNVPVGVNIQGNILISNNTQSTLSDKNMRHILLVETDNFQGFQLFIIDNNTFLEGNAPILLNSTTTLTKFNFLQLENNKVQNGAQKGLLGLPNGYTGSTLISLINNIVPPGSNPTGWASGWTSATTPSTYDIGVNNLSPILLSFQTESYWSVIGHV